MCADSATASLIYIYIYACCSYIVVIKVVLVVRIIVKVKIVVDVTIIVVVVIGGSSNRLSKVVVGIAMIIVKISEKEEILK